MQQTKVSPERHGELKADLARNNTRHLRRWLRAYLQWLHRDDDPAQRLCDAGNPTWVVHAEKGDGGLTDHERAVLEACPRARVVTLAGYIFFLPIDASGAIASVITEALAASSGR